jgi:hypothetical protein
MQVTQRIVFSLFVFFSFNANGLFATSIIDSLFTIHSPVQTDESIVQYAREHLPHTGVLQQGPDGFVYVKVDDRYIKELYPMLDLEGYVMPPYFRRPDSPGAHISVFYVFESEQIGHLAELGRTYEFKVEGLAFVPYKHPKFAVLHVSSPELEHLRQKYGFSPLLQNHDFHITIAEKPKHKR